MIIFIPFQRKKCVILTYMYVQSFANFNLKFFVNSATLLLVWLFLLYNLLLIKQIRYKDKIHTFVRLSLLFYKGECFYTDKIPTG